MRTRNCWMLLAVTVTVSARLQVPAQDWETVDDFAPVGGNAQAHGVAVDPAGRIYVVGTADGHGIVRYSADDGSNWITRDDFVYGSASNTVFNAVTVDRTGAVFVGGAAGLSWIGHWLVRRSADQGVSWNTVDDYFVPRNFPEEGTNAAVYSLSSDDQGRVYGAGTMLRTGPSYPFWLVRGSGIGGTNWETKLTLFSGYHEVSELTCAGEAVYVTGAIDASYDGGDGLILRSSDQGATWTTNFEAVGEVHSAITADPGGAIYTAGAHWISSTSIVWLVRRADPGGTNWTTLDTLLYNQTDAAGVDSPFPNSIAVDTRGNVCVAGQFTDYWVIDLTNGMMYGADTTWFTRQYVAAADQWVTTDLFSYSTNRQGAALGTAIAPSGSLFVAGYGTSDTGQQRWVVRRQVSRLTPFRIQIARAGTSGMVSWPATDTNWVLQWTASLDVNPDWQNFTGTVSAIDGHKLAAVELTGERRFFRLKSTASP